MSLALSILIPVRNEEENVNIISKEIIQKIATPSYEIIFINDFSEDDTEKELIKLNATNIKIVYYNNLTQVYLFQSENLNYKTSDVYKPEKPKKVEKSITKPSVVADEKKEILDALTGAKTLLKYVKGKEKTNLLAYIRGLEILMK